MEETQAKLKDQTFGLFFTTKGKSIENWDRLGMLKREIKLYQYTARYFKKLYIFTYGGKKDKEYQNLFPENVTIIPKPKYIPIVLYSFLLPIIRMKTVRTLTLLKTNQMDGSWAAVIAKKLYGGKLIVRCGYEWLQTLERSKGRSLKVKFAEWAERFAYRNADVVIHTSHEAINFTIERFGIHNEKIIYIPNYVDTDTFVPRQEGKREGVIFIGRLEKEKNLHSLIDALAGLDVPLTLIGDGSLNGDLKNRAKEKGVTVTFLGKIPQAQIPQEIARHKIFILPSLYEGNPKALLEAMACGIACIATDVSGNREVITDGKNGLLCTTDSEHIRSAIDRLVSNDALRTNLGEQARNEVLSRYGFDKILEQELSVYNKL